MHLCRGGGDRRIMFLVTVQRICGRTEPAYNASCGLLQLACYFSWAEQIATRVSRKCREDQDGECTLPSKLSLWDTRVGNFPALFNPGPNRRGICLMTVSLAKKALYFLAAQAQQYQFPP